MADIAGTTSRSRRGRAVDNLSREDWIAAAWEMLGEAGVDGVRVEPLARKLGVTKGSFYWHFRERRELLEALLDYWFGIWDEQTSSEVETAGEPADRIWALFRSVLGRGSRGQTVSLRLWSHREPEVARRIEERDRRRLDFLTAQLEEIGFSREEARVRGQIYQAITTGEYLRSGGLPFEERIARAEAFHRTLSSR